MEKISLTRFLKQSKILKNHKRLKTSAIYNFDNYLHFLIKQVVLFSTSFYEIVFAGITAAFLLLIQCK